MATTLFRRTTNCEQTHSCDVTTRLSKSETYLSIVQRFVNSIHKPIVSTLETEAYISHTIYIYFKKYLKLKAATTNISVYSL
jgi:hypothetical protein